MPKEQRTGKESWRKILAMHIDKHVIKPEKIELSTLELFVIIFIVLTLIACSISV